jgi:hypothetical protein
MLICQAEANECEVAVMGFAYVNESGKMISEGEYSNYPAISMTREEAISKEFDIPLSIRLVMWNKIFRREVLEGLSYDEKLKASEDTLLLHQCLKKVHKVFWNPKPLYINVQREGSAMHGGLKVYDMEKSLDVHKSILEDVKMNYPQIYEKALYHYLDTCIWKMRSQMPVPTTLPLDEQRKYQTSLNGMKRHIRNEYKNIIFCRGFSIKRKLAYLWIGIRG